MPENMGSKTAGSGSKKPVLSFDLDGTLIRHDYGTAVWREAVPELVARQRGMSLEEAKEWVYAQYDSVGDRAMEWYDIAYWFDRFRLEEDWKKTLWDWREKIGVYPEVPEVLETLSKQFRMVVLSNASRPFLEIEMAFGGLDGVFEAAVSATTDLREVKKTESFYRKVFEQLGIEHTDVIHVGDHREFDYEAPCLAGIEAYYLDRSGEEQGPAVVPDLAVFVERVADRIKGKHPGR